MRMTTNHSEGEGTASKTRLQMSRASFPTIVNSQPLVCLLTLHICDTIPTVNLSLYTEILNRKITNLECLLESLESKDQLTQ